MKQEDIKRITIYKEGGLYWAINKKRASKGNRVGAEEPSGYRRVQIDNKQYREHQLVFLYHYGYIPKVIDHINRDTKDNRIENLRDSSYSLNSRNKVYKGKSKYRGLYQDKNTGKWVVRGRKDGKTIRIGSYSSEQEAGEAFVTWVNSNLSEEEQSYTVYTNNRR